MAPLFDKANTPLLKAWVVKRLEDNSDADADVLADYVLALLQHDGDVASIRKLCEEETKDFLKEEDSSTFINDVFKTLANKSYLPPSARPKPAESHSYDPTLPLEGFQPNQVAQYPGTAPLNGSRKRSYHEGLGDDAQDPSYHSGAPRAFKQPRRGYGASDAPLDYGPPSFPPGHAASPSLLPASPAYANFPPLDPTHAQAFQFPPGPYPGQTMARPNPYMRKKKPRCWEFDSKGYCSRGLTCKYDHSVDFSVMQPPQLPAGGDADEGYDPEDPTFILQAPPPLPMPPPMNYGRGSGRRRRGESRRGESRRGGRGPGRGRAAFSADGPLKDPKRTAIVVENIPEESFSEDLVRDFFSQFGTIVEVSMRPYKHLAVVKFDSHQTANAAYRSPKVIFDNRFVKVFWYKEEADGPTLGRGKASNGTNGHEGTPSEQDGQEINMEDFMQKQAEAQKAYEEKKGRRDALQKQKEELDKRQQELIERQLEAKQKLEARLGSAATEDEAPNSTAGSLRMQLKKLEEEARILGLDPHDPSHAHDEESTTNHEGVWTRGGYRGRGAYRGRGRGRGGIGGGYGGGYGDVHEAYAAYSLDNRPRKVAVTGADFTVPANDEALRQFLLGVGDYAAIEATPSTTHIVFKDRRTAENFYAGVNGKPLPGQEDTLTLAWVANNTPSIAPPAKEEQHGEAMDVEPSKKDESAEAKLEEKEEKVEKEEKEEGEVQQGDMDYEVADESEWIQ